jgi:hypothetical protein
LTFYNTAVLPVICEGGHFTHMWDRITSLTGKDWTHQARFNPAIFY